ncbi:MAG: 50S ribosomal protein L6 [Phycisphaerales bacterium]
MSRIGKQPVAVPAGVKVTIKGPTQVQVQGPVGTLTLDHRPEVKVRWGEAEKSIFVSIADKDMGDAQARAHWGTTRAHLRNMVEGVTKGFEKTLEVVGVGWTAALTGKALKLTIGYANPIVMPIPDGLTVKVEKAIVKITGPDRGTVGRFAAEVRAKRKPEPYQGKGIKYTDETIKRKQGKQFGTATA